MIKLIFAALISSLFTGLCFFLFWFVTTSQFSWGILTFIVAFCFSLITNLFLGIPITLVLKHFNSLSWLSINACGFALGFIMYFLSMILFGNNGDLAASSLLTASLITGIVGLITSAAFYKSLLWIENRSNKVIVES